MKKILVLALLPYTVSADCRNEDAAHPHDGHIHEEWVDGKPIAVDKERFEKFRSSLSSSQIAIISVKGMVCDFCARGLEKTFKKDDQVIRVDVDLAKGKILVAYNEEKEIDFAEIEKKIIGNGLTSTHIQILKI